MKDWEQFEVAVERFVAALDPRVTVRATFAAVSLQNPGHNAPAIWFNTRPQSSTGKAFDAKSQ